MRNRESETFVGPVMTRFRPQRTSSSRIACIALGLVAGLTACTTEEAGMNVLDGPMDVTILEPDGNIDVHAGFVTNFRSGKIVKLDLKHETYLRDLPYASWIRSSPLATGDDRYLDQVSVFSQRGSDTDYGITLLASDSSRDQLLIIPYLDASFVPQGGCTGFTPAIPRRPLCIPELASQLEVNASLRTGTLPILTSATGGTPIAGLTASGFWLREGKTTTEDWIVVYDEARGTFRVSGSRSGLQVKEAELGQIYYSDGNEVEFIITAEAGVTPTAGSGFRFTTDTGIVEVDMPGLVGDLRVLPEQSLVLASVQVEPESLEEPVKGLLVGIDISAVQNGEAPSVAFEVPLCPDMGLDDGEACPFDVKPQGIELDVEGLRLFMSDGGDGGGVYEVDLTTEPPTWRVIPGFGPNLDVAYVEDKTSDEGVQNLFIATLDDGNVFVYDLRAGRALDVNPMTPEIDPVRLRTPVRAIAAGQVAVETRNATDEQVPILSIPVVASTFEGQLFAIQGEDGCVIYGSPTRGTVSTSTSELALTEDRGAPSNPAMLPFNAGNGSTLALLSTCGGISPSETWNFIYDALEGAYRVRGSVSNKSGEFQQNMAYENERYVSDGGQISVFIQGGTLPTTDGDSFTLTVVGNTTPYTAGSYTGDIALYTQTYGDRNSPWTLLNFRAVAVVPVIATDRIMKLDTAWFSNATNAEQAEYR